MKYIFLYLIIPFSSALAAVSPNLRPLSRTQALILLQKAKNAQILFKTADKKNLSSFGVPWPYLVGNHCAQRALVTYLSIASDQVTAQFESPLSDDVTDQVLDRPQVEAARISLYAPIGLDHKITFPNGKSKVYEKISWNNHEALAINVEGTMMVVDLSASERPLSIQDWIATYTREKCGQISAQDYNDILLYANCILGGGIPGHPLKCVKPKYNCGFKYLDSLGFDASIRDGSWGGLSFFFEEATITLQDDAMKLVEAANGRLDPSKQAPFLNHSIKVLSRTWTEPVPK